MNFQMTKFLNFKNMQVKFEICKLKIKFYVFHSKTWHRSRHF